MYQSHINSQGIQIDLALRSMHYLAKFMDQAVLWDICLFSHWMVSLEARNSLLPISWSTLIRNGNYG